MKLKVQAVMVLSFDDRRKFAYFYQVLYRVDQRMKKKSREKKRQKTKTELILGPPVRGPCFFRQFDYL